MNNFNYCSPTRFCFGKDAEQNTGELISSMGSKKVLLHYGGSSAEKSGLLSRVKTSLTKAGVDFVALGGVCPNPRDELVYEGIALCRKENVDFVLCVGGGSVIDSGKAIAAGVLYDGDFWDFFEGKVTVQKALPVGVVLTIPAAGSEASSGSVVTKVEGLLKRSFGGDCLRPKFAVMNPELTYTLPPYQTACGVVDIMAHVFERYVTQVNGVDFSDRLCESVLSSIIKNAPIALKEPENYDARANIMWAGTLAHNDLVGLGREGDWSSHQIEHELSALYDVAHGAGLAVIVPAFCRYQYKHNIALFAQLAVRVFGVDMDYRNPENTAMEGIDRLEAFFKIIGMPTSFAELGAKEQDIPELTAKCHLNNGDKMGCFHPIPREEIANIYKLACK